MGTKNRPAASGISRGMRTALIITLLLTGASFGIRQWRESKATGTPPSFDNTAENRTATPLSTVATTKPTPPSPTIAGLRAESPAAQGNPMARRNAPPPPVESPKSPEQTPQQQVVPPPAQDPPAFRLIGRHLDGKRWTAFFAHDNHVIAASPRTELPGGFVLHAIRKNSVLVIRRSNREKIEMPMEMPK